MAWDGHIISVTFFKMSKWFCDDIQEALSIFKASNGVRKVILLLFFMCSVNDTQDSVLSWFIFGN